MLEAPHPPEVPPVPPEVASFAASHGAADDVQTVLKLTSRLFPGSVKRVRLEDDSDLCDRHILVEVDARSYDDQRLALAQTEWTDELFRECPSSHICLFRLALV